jgi:hypothetical protein
MDLDHDKSEEYQKALSSQKVKKKKVVNRKTVPLHWTASTLPPDELDQSIFSRSGKKNPKVETEKLKKEFRKKENAHTGQLKTGQSNARNGTANVIDIASANNIAIQLKAFNNFTPQGLAETINDLDPEGKIDGERIQLLSTILSHSKFQANLQAIGDFNGDSDQLNPAELFLQHLLPVKRVKGKVEVMKAMQTFNEHANEATMAFNTLGELCGQIRHSRKLAQVLLMVLDIGNVLNEGTVDGGVKAFKFESLEKLSHTKSADGKTTVLDHIVKTFIESEEGGTLLLTSDFPDIQVC